MKKKYPKTEIKIWLEEESKRPLKIKSTLKRSWERFTEFSFNNNFISDKELKSKLRKFNKKIK